jgi:hypothetical protein
LTKAAAFKSHKKSARVALGHIKILQTHIRQQENTVQIEAVGFYPGQKPYIVLIQIGGL